jgi:hypothetical protein
MTHSSQTISPLRQRMIDDMTLRKLNPKTQDAYIRSVIKLTRFLGCEQASKYCHTWRRKLISPVSQLVGLSTS